MTSPLFQAKSSADDVESILPCGPCQERLCGVCGAVSRNDLTRLAAAATIADVARGRTFIHEGAAAEHFYILILGGAKLYKLLPDGRRQIVSFEYRGSLLGLAASSGYSFSAEAISPVRMCRISKRKLQNIMRDCREMEQRLLDVAIGDLLRAQEQMLLLGRKTAVERIASFLLSHKSCPQPQGVKPPRLHLSMSRLDIADYQGMTNETISRALARLKQRGVIAVPNVHEVVILDGALLEEFAGGATPMPESAAG